MADKELKDLKGMLEKLFSLAETSQLQMVGLLKEVADQRMQISTLMTQIGEQRVQIRDLRSLLQDSTKQTKAVTASVLDLVC